MPFAAALLAALATVSLAPAATTFHESFEGGPVGTQPTSADTAYDQSLGDRGDGSGNVHALFVAGGRSGHGVRFTNSPVTASTFGFLGKNVGQRTSLYLRRYYRLDALPGYRTSVLLYKFGGGGNGQLGGTHNGSFAFGGSGQHHHFALVDNNSVVATSRTDVPLHAWFRVEVRLHFAGGVGTQTVRLFLGNNVDGTTPTETVTASLTGPRTDYVEDGILTNPGVPIAYTVDEAVDGTDWIGPRR